MEPFQNLMDVIGKVGAKATQKQDGKYIKDG